MTLLSDSTQQDGCWRFVGVPYCHNILCNENNSWQYDILNILREQRQFKDLEDFVGWPRSSDHRTAEAQTTTFLRILNWGSSFLRNYPFLGAVIIWHHPSAKHHWVGANIWRRAWCLVNGSPPFSVLCSPCPRVYMHWTYQLSHRDWKKHVSMIGCCNLIWEPKRIQKQLSASLSSVATAFFSEQVMSVRIWTAS